MMLVSRAIRTLLPACSDFCVKMASERQMGTVPLLRICVPIVANKRAELAVYTTYTLHTCPLWL